MNRTTQALIGRFYRAEEHPYRIFESAIISFAGPGTLVLDAGCGRRSEAGALIAQNGARVIGLDLVDHGDERIAFVKSTLERIPLPSASVDLVISRSVMEHLRDPLSAWKEMGRVLKPGGSFVFLTPNFFDYVSILAWLIPNSLHPTIVKFVEGREEQDVFPTVYRCNTPRAIRRLASQSGFAEPYVRYLTQYPSALRFSRIVFLLGVVYERLSRIPPLRFLQPWLLVVVKKANTASCGQSSPSARCPSSVLLR